MCYRRKKGNFLKHLGTHSLYFFFFIFFFLKEENTLVVYSSSYSTSETIANTYFIFLFRVPSNSCLLQNLALAFGIF